MADIFISYAREDREWVEKLANALVAEGYSVWWDWDLLVGKRYRETIETELQTAKAAVVVWSQHSVRSDFVRDEAEDAQQRNMLLPLLKEIVRPPAGFRQLQTADLSNWHGGGEHTEFRRMMKGVSSLVGRPSTGDRGIIPVDPAHPTTHFTEETPAAAPAPAAPMPMTTPPDSPVVIEAKVPEPAPTPAPPPPSPPVQAAPAPAAAFVPPAPGSTAIHKSNPVIMFVAIGAVALIALIFIALQFVPSSTKPAAAAGGGTPAAAATAAHGGAPAHVPPGLGGPPAPTGGAANGGANGGDDTGGDVGQAGPHGGATPPPAPPTPPTNNGADDGGGDSGDTGQGNTH